VTGGSTTVTPLATYRNDTPYPFCPGCGHRDILDRLNDALVEAQIDPQKVVIVSDIGCAGLSDQYFATSAFHGLHGRSITYAAGIKLARPELSVVVVMGDGGTGIGGTHLLSAARRNIGITVLVFNNFNFGMTGGQHSPTTPAGGLTATTPSGNLERPLDICGTVAAGGASFVFRGTSFDEDLSERIAQGMRHEGFSLLDISELCTAYYVPKNRLNRAALADMLRRLELPTGLLQRRDGPEYAAAYRAAHEAVVGTPTLSSVPIEADATAMLDRRLRLVVAGSAGGKVGSAVRLVAQAAIATGLWAAQRNDFPVTVQSGHSVSELILSPEEIHYPGVTKPDALVILSADGRKKAARYLAAMDANDLVFTVPEFADVETRASISVIDPKQASIRLSKTSVALAALTAVIGRLNPFPAAAIEEAVRRAGGDHVETHLRAVSAGLELA
jgi:2-oxoglutarate ferredoxin oxidoreductase subunit beta